MITVLEEILQLFELDYVMSSVSMFLSSIFVYKFIFRSRDFSYKYIIIAQEKELKIDVHDTSENISCDI